MNGGFVGCFGLEVMRFDFLFRWVLHGFGWFCFLLFQQTSMPLMGCTPVWFVNQICLDRRSLYDLTTWLFNNNEKIWCKTCNIEFSNVKTVFDVKKIWYK